MTSIHSCYHCDLPIAVEDKHKYQIQIDDEMRDMCCPGCLAVAQLILSNGLEDYYQYREKPNATGQANNPDILENLLLFNKPAFENKYTIDKEHFKRATIFIEGITCAACTWLIEQSLSQLEPILEVNVNGSTHRASISWDSSRLHLGDILKSILDIGYKAYPYQSSEQERALKKEHRLALKRLLLSGLGMMQVMMFAVGTYLGEYHGIKLEYQYYLHLVSLMVATPVLMYSGRPFFINAYRDLKNKQLGMDVPISIALCLAYGASVVATFFKWDAVYFDSVCMFIFFLLLGRFYEMRIRHKMFYAINKSVIQEPLKDRKAVKLNAEYKKDSVVPVDEIKVGELLLVKEGESIPVDSCLVEGRALIDESMLNGESVLQEKRLGQKLYGGTLNTTSPIVIRSVSDHINSTANLITKMSEYAENEKPMIVGLANTISKWFVAFVLMLASCVAIYWSIQDPSRAFGITLSVLVVTCPCALALATPIAFTAALEAISKTPQQNFYACKLNKSLVIFSYPLIPNNCTTKILDPGE